AIAAVAQHVARRRVEVLRVTRLAVPARAPAFDLSAVRHGQAECLIPRVHDVFGRSAADELATAVHGVLQTVGHIGVHPTRDRFDVAIAIRDRAAILDAALRAGASLVTGLVGFAGVIGAVGVGVGARAVVARHGARPGRQALRAVAGAIGVRLAGPPRLMAL